MDRREFLIGAMTLAGGVVAPPLLAHPKQREALNSGTRMLLSAEVASRGTKVYKAGLAIDVWTHSPAAEYLSSVSAAMRCFDDRLSSSDRNRLQRNLSILVERLEDILDRHQARHFCSHWHHHSGSVFEAREHLESCAACRDSWRTLLRGTRIDLVPLTIEDEVTVVAKPEGPGPRSPLRLPEVPTALRPALQGKELRLKVDIDRYGVAHVTRVWSPGISDFVVERAVAQVESTPWKAARAHGHSIDDTIRVIFRWQS